MAGIPVDWLFNRIGHTIVVERYLGPSSKGATFEAPETLTGYYEDGRRVIRQSDGREVISTATVYVPPQSQPIPPESRVTAFGRTATVIEALVCDGGGLPTPNHVELRLT